MRITSNTESYFQFLLINPFPSKIPLVVAVFFWPQKYQIYIAHESVPHSISKKSKFIQCKGNKSALKLNTS